MTLTAALITLYVSVTPLLSGAFDPFPDKRFQSQGWLNSGPLGMDHGGWEGVGRVVAVADWDGDGL